MNQTDESRAPLLQGVATGDPASISQCLDRYGGLVWSLALRFAARNEAEDAVQEIFIALWRAAGRFDPAKGSESTFVAMVARRRLIDRKRSERRSPTAVADGSATALDQHADPAAESERMENVLDGARVAQALEQLRPDEQRVIKLSIVAGMTHQEVAAATGLPLGTVKTHVRRGIARLRALMSPPAAVEGGS